MIEDKEFTLLFESYYSDLCFYANSFLRDFELSRDIVQDIYFKLWNKREVLPLLDELEPYLYKSVKNRCLDHLKREQAKDKYRNRILHMVAQEKPHFSDHLEQQEIIQQIEKAIDSFPELTMQIFDLSRNKGLKYQEIAAKLGISVKTVEAHISKALRILRYELKEYLPQSILIVFLKEFL